MNVADIRAQIEVEITDRRNELRFLTNILLGLEDTEARARFRKALVVMLYAHLEGFVRAALTIYVRAINQESLTCERLNESLVASVLARAFDDLNSSRKSSYFRNELPHDEPLHRFARRVDFVTVFPGILASIKAEVPEEVVDMESNLKPVVLKKNLFRLGFDPDLLSDYDGSLHQLLRRRNDVAHGVLTGGIDEAAFEPLQRAAFDIMDSISQEIGRALEEGAYLRRDAAA